MTTVIKEFGNLFDLVLEEGVGMNNTPWTGLAVKSKGLAEKYVIEVELNSTFVRFEGEPIKFTYNRVYVNQGMRGVVNTLEETRECIAVLTEAVRVAEEVQVYLKLNGWWNA